MSIWKNVQPKRGVDSPNLNPAVMLQLDAILVITT
ncbi:uncharacterized protein METZ01_LOCUS463879 [marine metagenome]|uniref:Uncharacterized protein n=1 Tax=marine metagenome TaxID=408172 RepID=A0A383AV05_9ZZZZ